MNYPANTCAMQNKTGKIGKAVLAHCLHHKLNLIKQPSCLSY